MVYVFTAFLLAVGGACLISQRLGTNNRGCCTVPIEQDVRIRNAEREEFLYGPSTAERRHLDHH